MELAGLRAGNGTLVGDVLAAVVIQGEIHPCNAQTRNVRDNIVQSLEIQGGTTHTGKTHHATMVCRTPANQAAGEAITQQVSRIGVAMQTGAARAHGEARLGDRDTDTGI